MPQTLFFPYSFLHLSVKQPFIGGKLRRSSVPLGTGSPAEHRLESSTPSVAQGSLSAVLGRLNFKNEASAASDVNSSNQAGAVLKISVNFSLHPTRSKFGTGPLPL
jgi:hypothetical protein